MTHKIWMQFFLRKGWIVNFIDSATGQPVTASRRYEDPTKITDMAERGGGLRNLEDHQMIELLTSRAAAP